jgi:hypothetical protein
MNNLDYISESLKPIFWVKILKFFDADPGSRMEKFRSGKEKIQIRDRHPGSATLISSHPFSIKKGNIRNRGYRNRSDTGTGIYNIRYLRLGMV